ncbi:MAG: hypothetical protein JWM74_2214 [Myxococcaceae bacterium]|nr:hypothetical protein [Myxococcaceae bacterium]
MRPLLLASASGLVLAGSLGCSAPTPYRANVEVIQVQTFGKDPKVPAGMDVEMRYVDCPGDSRRILRGDKAFTACASKLKAGDKVPVDLLASYNSEKGSYRVVVTKLGDCAVKQDPKDEANYEIVETCTDVKASGEVVGVHCDRTRSKELVAKCPWLRRK